jgi:hypothetical protein
VLGRRYAPGAAEGLDEAHPIVEPEILRVILLPRQLDALLTQYGTEGLAVVLLVVHQHAVEVEQHGLGRGHA